MPNKIKNIKLRIANTNDAKKISELYKRVWDEQKGAFPEELLKVRQPDEEEMKKWINNETYFVAMYNNDIVGVIGCRIEYFTCKAIHMVVKKDMRGIGIGSLLLDRVEKFAIKNSANKIWFDTSTRLVDTIEFYKKRGFRVVGVLKKHFWGEDIILFEKML